jgi:hypothetical protein
MAGVDLGASIALDDGHVLSCRAEQVRGRQTRDAAADHNHVHVEVAIDRTEPWERRGIGPVRQRSGMRS